MSPVKLQSMVIKRRPEWQEKPASHSGAMGKGFDAPDRPSFDHPQDADNLISGVFRTLAHSSAMLCAPFIASNKIISRHACNLTGDMP